MGGGQPLAVRDELLDADYPLDDVMQALSDSAARKVTRASLVVS